MKLTTVQVEYDAERLEALRMYLKDNGTTVEKEMALMRDALFRKNVPAQVRTFFEMRSGAEPNKPKGKPDRATVSAKEGADDKSTAPETRQPGGAF